MSSEKGDPFKLYKRVVGPNTPMRIQAMIDVMDSSNTSTIRQLAEIAHLDLSTAFRRAKLRGATFGEDDLAGFDFSGTDLSYVDLSHARNINRAVFNSRTKLKGAKLPPGVTRAQIRKQNRSRIS